MGREDRSLTLLLLGRRGARAFEWSGTRRRAAAIAGAAGLGLVAVGVGLGLLLGELRESARVAELRDEIRHLRDESGRVELLAARLDSMEQAYRRIRRVMSGDVAVSERDVGLPAAAGEEGTAPRETEPLPRSGEGWIWPLAQAGFVTRAHGEPRVGGTSREGHPGLDIAVPTGSYVRASRTGRVEVVGRDSVYGLFVRVRHGGGVTSLYGHNRWVFVAEDDSVEQGEVVALSGNSGRSTAPHLHFELAREGRALDPAELLDDDIARRAIPGRGERRP